MVSGLPYGIVLGRAFARLRLCVKRLLPGGPSAKTDDGAKSRHHRNAGPGPSAAGIQRQGAKPPRRNRIFFYYETRKPGIIEKISWCPGLLRACLKKEKRIKPLI